MKKIIPIIGAVIIFLAASALLRPAPATNVVVVAYDLQAGSLLAEQDLLLQAMPASIVPQDALTIISEAVGQPLRVDRGQGDILRASQLGAPAAQLEPNERAIALRVTDASGVGGTLLPGQRVGVVAVINQTGTTNTNFSFSIAPGGDAVPEQPDTDPRYSQSGLYAKAAVEGLRILYVDSAWSAVQTQRLPVNEPQQGNALPVGGVVTNERAESGSVILAAPVDLQTIVYDFRADGGTRQSRAVNAIELLAALASMDGVKFSLYLMPPGEATQGFTSPGLWLPDLVLFPQPTPTPDGARP